MCYYGATTYSYAIYFLANSDIAVVTSSYLQMSFIAIYSGEGYGISVLGRW